MRYVHLFCILLVSVVFASCLNEPDKSTDRIKEFEELFGSDVRERANTAVNVAYLSQIEKEVYYYLNLARLNPKLFEQTFVANFNGIPGHTLGYAFEERKQSLIDYMSTMEPLDALVHDDMLYEMAECFAIEGGNIGVMGHDRSSTRCAVAYSAECCCYAETDSGLWYVLSLLVDAGENNAALGHRKILLEMEDRRFSYLGVSVRSHTSRFKQWAVLDMWTETAKAYYQND